MTNEERATQPRYGQQDTTFRAAGGESGIARLVDSFYDIMSTKPEYARIYAWHPNDEMARDKLARFLCGWMGGPKRYREKYGPISIPKVHAHLPITEAERDMWLNCMAAALAAQPYADSLRRYLLEQLAVPANHVLRHSAASGTADQQTSASVPDE
ncbi:MAG: group II truncated hemoglobin [Pseudomonadota bacterium]